MKQSGTFRTRAFAAFGFLIVLSGCTISQKVNPVGSLAQKEICIIKNPAVRRGFIQEYRNALEAKHFTVKMLPEGSATDSCPVTSTYVARWSWDLAIYMSYAEIKVFVDGKQSGDAVYDSRSGGGNLGKFVRGNEKIWELVELLFP